LNCKWCNDDDVSLGHVCASMPVDLRHEQRNYIVNMAAAVGASGRYYVMIEPTWNFVGAFVRLILAKASDSLVNDTIIDRREIKITEGGWAHLNSKYGDPGRLESFDDLSAAQSKHSAYLKEVMVFAR
jgi:hypothetical protein